MTRAELKQQAKDSLKGRWGTAIAIVLIYELILSGLSLAANFIPFVGTTAVFIISIPIAYGYIGQMLKFTRGEEVGLCDYFKIGFDNFGKAWSITGHTLLKLLPALIAYVASVFIFIGAMMVAIENGDAESFIIAVIVGIVAFIASIIFLMVKSYLYVLTDYIGNDQNELDGKACVEKSQSLMKGHRFEYFVLQLSFLGWIILAMLTFGIGLIFLEPYMQVTNVKFFESLAGNNNTNNEVA